MGNLFRRFSDWFALFGLMFLMVGMIGTARQFKDIFMMRAEPQEEGFLPITVEVVDGKSLTRHAPGMSSGSSLATAPEVQAGPTMTPFLPMEAALEEGAEIPGQSTAQDTLALADHAAQGNDSTVEAGSAATLEAPEVSSVAENSPPTAAPTLDPVVPDWIRISVIDLEAPVVSVSPEKVNLNGRLFEQWIAPNMPAAGWHDRSARLGEMGNVVLNGHHNIYGSVFSSLKDLEAGNEIVVFSQDRVFIYVVAQVLLLEERYATLDQRTNNAQWILPSEDNRLTLVTCWPPESNTHRLIVVARLVGNP
jgi:LPXTG-site transpeptidase (sortase) family protein